MQLLLRNFFDHSLIPAPQSHVLSSLNAILMNDSTSYPQTQIMSLPNPYPISNQVFGQGQLEPTHMGGVRSQWTRSHGRTEGQQAIQHCIQGVDDNIGPVNLVRDASNVSEQAICCIRLGRC
jgi:hypothetical protein